MGAQRVTDVCCDGTINNAGTEACDDGNSDDAAWCTSCVINMCGDWVVNNAGAEECNDGNSIDADGCTSCAVTGSTTMPGRRSAMTGTVSMQTGARAARLTSAATGS
eukprot:3936321-Rhodomonas_salina.3